MPDLPQAVKDAARKSEELSKQLQLAEKTETDNPEMVTDYIEPIEYVEPAPAEPEVEPEKIEETEQPSIEEETISVEPEEEVTVEEEEVEEEVEEKDYKAMYLTLQGKYNAEVPRLAEEVRNLKSQLEAQTKLEDIPAASEFELTPEDFEDYGEEFTSLVTAFKNLEKRNAHLEKLAQNIGTVQGKNNKESFEATLDTLCPDWKALNVNANLITWLQEVDGFSGLTKQQVLNDAAGKFNAKTVADIFNKFKKEHAIPDGKNKQPKTSLQNEVQPSTVKTETVKPRKKGKMWKRSDIAQFYRDKIDGKVSGKQADAMERDIFLANQEGRISD